MFDYLDNLLRHLLGTVTGLSEAQVGFIAPDKDWRNQVATLNQGMLNVHLVEVRENRKLRSNIVERELVGGTWNRDAGAGAGRCSLPDLRVVAHVGLTASRARHADAILDGAERAGYQVVAADLVTAPEDGHRHLLTQAAVIAGVVTPGVGSLPDACRITEYVRAIGAGRKLGLVENAAGTPSSVATLADEEQVPLLASVSKVPAFDLAGDRGVPAWVDDARVEAAIAPLATAAWFRAAQLRAPPAGSAGDRPALSAPGREGVNEFAGRPPLSGKMLGSIRTQRDPWTTEAE